MSASAESLAAAASLDKYGDEDIFSLLIRYGLYVGALFQFICISAAVLMENNPESGGSPESGEVTEREGEPVRTRLHKIRKLEKKKRR
ncbi:protein anon-73B1 [Drosophila takahashii]|uniref:protein anon-73B1 n=1 Tax=Drosophila takahashii TaxID=29030 RepID=UPI001CF88005|nr:protein anon-73B1 [Drosophila takahashii]